MADVRVWTNEPRPVWIRVSDHVHAYEVAWRDTDDGPVITDLRVHSDDGIPITKSTLARINTDALARTARRYDTTDAAEAGRQMRNALEEAFADRDPATMVAEAIAYLDEQGQHDHAQELRRVADEVGPAAMVASGFEGVEATRWTEGVIDAVIRHAPPGAQLSESKRRRVGRPKTITRDFLVLVADWAREAHDRNARPVYPFIAERATEHLVTVGRLKSHEKVQVDTVKGWVRRAKDAGLLAPDEFRKRRRDPNAINDDSQ